MIYYKDSRNLPFIDDKSINLVITSPPYPMIQMWDPLFTQLNPEIEDALHKNEGQAAFILMHRELDKVWSELYRVMKNGGIVCINIGDATRTIGDNFRLYSNHSRITEYCISIGFEALPVILWQKPTNSPTKFMGSGMYPGGAYVTLEHEYILILRKNGKRQFPDQREKLIRRESAYFWEERNIWFSDIWDFRGIRQDLQHKDIRKRSAAFPFELAYRLINMYSVYGDMVLDPFLGTGTSMYAAMALCRNSRGIEIDKNFHTLIAGTFSAIMEKINLHTKNRILKHMDFISGCAQDKLKYINTYFDFPVITRQEIDLVLYHLDSIDLLNDNTFKAIHSPFPCERTV